MPEILFVCTGNTCRSPLAMAICRKMLAERLGCAVEELPGRGFHVNSAGLAAIMGDVSSAEARAVAEENGAELVSHRSQPLTEATLTGADFLFTMTEGHLRILQSLQVPFKASPRLLDPTGTDVVDPVGGDLEIYRSCARQIAGSLDHWMPEILGCFERGQDPLCEAPSGPLGKGS